MKLLSSLLDLVFPPRCAVCGGFIEKHALLCAPCDAAWPALKDSRCTICSDPFAAGPGHACADCLQDPPSFERLHASGLYEGKLLELILRLKYHGKERLAAVLGRKMAAVLPEGLAGFDVVLPVPLHVSRLRERGFNQAVLLAKAMKGDVPIDLFSLKKERPTSPQAMLKKEERRKNLRGAFRVENKTAFSGKSILVVDDVATTGETLREISRVLKTAGASRVEALVAARAI